MNRRGMGKRDDRMRTCGTCGEDLIPQAKVDARGRAVSKVFWRHLSDLGGFATGHAAVVLIGPIRRWCDFCGPKTPACWSYQVIPVTTMKIVTRAAAAPAQHEFTEDPTSSGDLNDTPWYACADCADLVQQNKWNALVRRAAQVRAERTGEQLTVDGRVRIRDTYREFETMRTGARVPIDWDR